MLRLLCLPRCCIYMMFARLCDHLVTLNIYQGTLR